MFCVSDSVSDTFPVFDFVDFKVEDSSLTPLALSVDMESFVAAGDCSSLVEVNVDVDDTRCFVRPCFLVEVDVASTFLVEIDVDVDDTCLAGPSVEVDHLGRDDSTLAFLQSGLLRCLVVLSVRTMTVV